MMTTHSPDLSSNYCKQRQARVKQLLAERGLDQALFFTCENIQYLTGFRSHPLMSAALCIDVDDGSILAAPVSAQNDMNVDQFISFTGQHRSTLRQNQNELALSTLLAEIGDLTNSRIGLERSSTALQLFENSSDKPTEYVDLESDLWQLRRKKDPDELLMIQKAIDCTAAMYETAREIIQPGINELDVYNELQSTAVRIAGEPLTRLGNDFQCGSPGGSPRDRKAQSGELYILDLGPAYRGYYADNCRTIAVNGDPTEEQHAAWERIVAVLKMVEETVKPGVSCKALFQRAQEMLDDYQSEAFFHHLGHGFGLYPHEAPHLNSHWNDLFEEGDCFTAEPGLYTKNLNAGIRLEENFLVTSDGVRKLTHFSLDL